MVIFIHLIVYNWIGRTWVYRLINLYHYMLRLRYTSHGNFWIPNKDNHKHQIPWSYIIHVYCTMHIHYVNR